MMLFYPPTLTVMLRNIVVPSETECIGCFTYDVVLPSNSDSCVKEQCCAL